jgi:PAS domain S-box-containing protein
MTVTAIDMKQAWSLKLYVLILMMLWSLAFAGLTFGQEASPPGKRSSQQVRIGMLANRGTEKCMEKWGPTAEYLTTKIPGYNFSILPLGFDQCKGAVKDKDVDFILVNPFLYAWLEMQYGINRIATLKNRLASGVHTVFGGVIFRRSDRKDIHNLMDLKGKSFMAVHRHSFGGWLMTRRELERVGIDPYRDFRNLVFGGTHDAVLYAVKEGKVDAGTVRTDTLERMAAEGKINPDDFYVLKDELKSKCIHKVHFLHSTDLYPEWPFARVAHTPDQLAEKVAVALISMSADCPAAEAAKSAGWTVPLTYQPVHDCLRELRVGPYERYGKVTLTQVVSQYRILLIACAALLLISVVFVVYIIRSRKRLMATMAALKESEKRFLDVMYESKDAVLLIDSGRFTNCNEATVKLLGYSDKREVLMKYPSELSPPLQPDGRNSAEKADEMVSTAFKYGFHRFEWIHRKAAGEALPVEVSLTPIIIGGKTQLHCLWRDISRIKQAENALQAEEARMRAISESAQDAILMMNPEGQISFWNPAAERILGYTETEAIGQDLHALIVPSKYHEAHRAGFPAFKKTGQGNAVGKTLDLEALRKDGTEIFVQLSLSSARLNDQWHAIGIIRDISENKRREEELRKTNRQLEEAVAWAKDMADHAEMANAAKSEFLANMSHEIRTPMNGVVGMTGLLLDTALNAEQRRYADIIRNSAESLLTVLNDILDFSKIEAGKLEIEEIEFNLHTLLEDFASSMALRAHGKGLEFICAAAPDIPAYLGGDPGRLRQILTNLTGNAIKFTPKGEIAVRANLVSETDAEVVLRFSVKDTGIGIPEDKQTSLFDKFSQADTSTTRRYGGTGLGLAISKQLTEIMGGGIGVLSEEGQGSEFWFTVRLEKRVGEARGMAPVSSIRGTCILVVDDNATNREVLMAQLKAWDLRAEEVPDGPAALKALCRARDNGDPFRAAIIDMQMPGMDGAALARIIKADETLKEVRLILMTSLGQRGDARKMEEIGFAAYLTKPMRQPELFDCLSTVLADRFPARPEHPIVTRYTVRELRQARGARILLAEDNITNQQVALEILKKMGLKADPVANGAEALKALATIPYDLALMDIHMPEMDGFEATRQIRSPEFPVLNSRIPIIAMTANALQEDREKCLKAGMNDYVSKPINFQILVEVLAKWLPKKNNTPEFSGKGHPDSEENIPPESGDNSLPVFDKAGMLARLMDNEGLARKLFETFLKDIPLQIKGLKGCLDTVDISGIERQAHTIKGASATVGGERLREVAFNMEKAAKAGNLGEVKGLMSKMENEYELLKQAIA